MSIEHARSHVVEGIQNGEANCASVALTAILPHQPSRRSLEMARYNFGNLKALAIVALNELESHGILAWPHTIAPGDTPSRFLHQIYQEVTHEIPYERFFGALIRTKEEITTNAHTSTHVIAVTSLHRGWKATVIDTSPQVITSPFSLVRKVPLTTLDRRIAKDESETRAVALVSFSEMKDRHLTASQRSYLDAMLDNQRMEFGTLVDEIEALGWTVHESVQQAQYSSQVEGMTKRRYRIDRRMHDTT